MAANGVSVRGCERATHSLSSKRAFTAAAANERCGLLTQSAPAALCPKILLSWIPGPRTGGPGPMTGPPVQGSRGGMQAGLLG